MHLFVFGMGFTAKVLVGRALARGWRVSATCRTEEKAADLVGMGVEAHIFNSADQKSAEISDWLMEADMVLASVPPAEAGDPVVRVFGAALERRGDGFKWVGYLSTTGVYGDWQGAWVDERTLPQPNVERSKWRLAAEGQWLRLAETHRVPVHVFRLAGIYGPGRNVIEKLKRGKARRIVRPGQVFSRIHVEDIATVLEASMAAPKRGEIYNVCDDEPAPPQDAVVYAAQLIGQEPPPEIPFATAALSPMGRSFYQSNRRVSNAKIKRELGVQLAFPSYREGLAGLV